MCMYFIIYYVISGVKEYIDMGIPSKKLVLGVPWYGYVYPCINYTEVSTHLCVPVVKLYLIFGGHLGWCKKLAYL